MTMALSLNLSARGQHADGVVGGSRRDSHLGENGIASLEAGETSSRTEHMECRLTCGQRPRPSEGVSQKIVRERCETSSNGAKQS